MRRTSTARTYKPRSIRVKETKYKKKFIWSIILSLVIIYAAVAWLLPFIIGGASALRKPTPPTGRRIAEDITLAPPTLNIPFEATNSASIDIPGYASPNSKVQLYLDDNLSQETETQDTGSFVFRSVNLSLGTNNIFGKTIDSSDKTSLPSKTIRVLYSNDKPKLDIGEPEDNKVLNSSSNKKVQVSGDTDPVNTVTINGQVVIVSNDGHFSTSLDINDGENTITIIATTQVGNSTQVQRKVIYQP